MARGNRISNYALWLVGAVFAFGVVAVGPGESDTLPPIPSGPPRAAIARAAIDRMFLAGFHFVETDVGLRGTNGRIEEGDWIPSHMFRKRILWDQAANYATDPNRNPPMSESCISVDDHKAGWGELVADGFGGYQTYVLLEIYRNRISAGKDGYEGSINGEPALFKVRDGFVVELRDPSGYDYRYSAFGLPEPVDCRL